MISFFTSENGVLKELEAPVTGCWISVVDPNPEEVRELIEDYGLDSGFVRSSIDERSRHVSSVRTTRPLSS